MVTTNSINGATSTHPGYYILNNSKAAEQINPQYNTGNTQDIFVSAQQSAGTSADEADDGKISFGSKIGNFFKGIISPVTSMFSSPGNFIKGALGIAACAGLCAITGGAATPFLVAGGAVLGGVQLAKGAVNAATAKTDAEAEAAWQDLGTGTFMVGSSIIGAKGAAKAANTAKVAGFEEASTAGRFASLKMCLKPSNLIEAGRTSFTNAKGTISGWWTGLKANAAKGSKAAAAEQPKTTKPTEQAKPKAAAQEQSAQTTKTNAMQEQIQTIKEQQASYPEGSKAWNEAQAEIDNLQGKIVSNNKELLSAERKLENLQAARRDAVKYNYKESTIRQIDSDIATAQQEVTNLKGAIQEQPIQQPAQNVQQPAQQAPQQPAQPAQTPKTGTMQEQIQTIKEQQASYQKGSKAWNEAQAEIDNLQSKIVSNNKELLSAERKLENLQAAKRDAVRYNYKESSIRQIDSDIAAAQQEVTNLKGAIQEQPIQQPAQNVQQPAQQPAAQQQPKATKPTEQPATAEQPAEPKTKMNFRKPSLVEITTGSSFANKAA